MHKHKSKRVKLTEKFKVRLTAKNEGIEYTDDTDVYRFNVSLQGDEWTVFTPPSKGDGYKLHALTDEEESRILPRITAYLQEIRWLLLFPRRYTVKVKRNVT